MAVLKVVEKALHLVELWVAEKAVLTVVEWVFAKAVRMVDLSVSLKVAR